MQPLGTLVFGVSAAIFGLIPIGTVRGIEPSKASPAELKAIYAAVGLKERKGKVLDDCEQPVWPKIDFVDLNGDDQAEVFVFVSSSCYGAAGGQLSLLIKDNSGRWKSNLGFPAGGYKVLSTKNKGYPDIEIGGPGFCFPVWRWNGTKYDIHKRCDR